jgi:hypothetical protein
MKKGDIQDLVSRSGVTYNLKAIRDLKTQLIPNKGVGIRGQTRTRGPGVPFLRHSHQNNIISFRRFSHYFLVLVNYIKDWYPYASTFAYAVDPRLTNESTGNHRHDQ